MCETSGVLCAVRCFPCLLEFAPLSFVLYHVVEYLDLVDVVLLLMSLCNKKCSRGWKTPVHKLVEHQSTCAPRGSTCREKYVKTS
jgi:hypothetical protein